MAIHAIRQGEASFEVAVEETLTTRDVERIAAALARRPHGAVATVDLRRVRTCEPRALLMLSRVLAASGAPHVLLGLTGADRRLLRYLEATSEVSSPA